MTEEFVTVSRGDWARTRNAHPEWRDHPIEMMVENAGVMQVVDRHGMLMMQAIYKQGIPKPIYTVAKDVPVITIGDEFRRIIRTTYEHVHQDIGDIFFEGADSSEERLSIAVEVTLDADRPLMLGNCTKEQWEEFKALGYDEMNRIARDALTRYT